MTDTHASLPATMKAAVMVGVREPLEIREIPLPEPGPEDALIRVTASGICRSDWHLWNGDWNWFVETPRTTVLGHEIGGVVAAVGRSVKRLKVGQRVTVPFNLACGHCPYCHSGEQNRCDNMRTPHLIPGGGGWAQYSRIPGADLNVVPLPDEVDELSAAALGCRYMTAWRAVRDRGAVRGGEFVAVVGCGGVGLAAIEICSALGGIPVAVDIDEEKLARAGTLGAAYAISAKGLSPGQTAQKIRDVTGSVGMHVAIDALGGSRTALPAIHSLRKGGRFVQVGLTGEEDKGRVSFPADDIVNNELSVIGSFGNPQSSFPELLALVGSRRLNPGAMVSRQVGLEDTGSVLAEMDRFATSGYVVITAF